MTPTARRLPELLRVRGTPGGDPRERCTAAAVLGAADRERVGAGTREREKHLSWEPPSSEPLTSEPPSPEPPSPEPLTLEPLSSEPLTSEPLS